MGEKSRNHFTVGDCLKERANRGKGCESCLRFSNYKPKEKENEYKR